MTHYDIVHNDWNAGVQRLIDKAPTLKAAVKATVGTPYLMDGPHMDADCLFKTSDVRPMRRRTTLRPVGTD